MSRSDYIIWLIVGAVVGIAILATVDLVKVYLP